MIKEIYLIKRKGKLRLEYIYKKIRAKKYFCKDCGKIFYRYYLSDFQYGERFLCTEDKRKQVYLNCFDNEEFIDEIGEIIKKFLPSISKIEEGRIFNIVLGKCCDEVEEERLVLEVDKEACETCLSNNVICMNNGDELLDAKLPCVTHKQWDSYNYADKKKVIYRELKLKGLL